MKEIKPHEDYFSVPEVAKASGTGRQAVWRNIQRGSILAKKVGNRYVVPAEEVLKLIQRRRERAAF